MYTAIFCDIGSFWVNGRGRSFAPLPGPIQSGHSCKCLKKYSESGAKCVTQCDRVLAYMRTNGSITSKEAMDHLGCERLASRICDLRKRGHCIIKYTEKGRNRYDEPTNYARYKLIEGVQNG